MNFSIEWLDEVSSTNDLLARRVMKNGADAEDGTLLVARMQTAGRGRHSRVWLAESGKNLLFSFFMKTDANLMDVPALTMGVAMGIDDALLDLGIESSLKWPNDVLVGNKKICGILSEGIADQGIIVGIGLNVNMTEESLAQIDRPATSVLAETGRECSVEEVLDRLLKNIPRWIERWEASRFEGLREMFERKCAAFYKRVEVRDGDRVATGVLVGFGSHGEVLLRRPDGSDVSVWAGDLGVKID